ncbi:hypothetical protein FBU59_003048 [Linderina macrospora]|uniref:Uncharacterized protein n=1 Tax=Linderina macrospora TaxID=4868 RepID=A0ACC1J9S0_9FUNG|nr:hypothetical protein FBU59_003048 [Linderina macrospora]
MFGRRRQTSHIEILALKRLSCRTFLMATCSPLGTSSAWKTTPKEPLPTTLQFVYTISVSSPVLASWAMPLLTLRGSKSPIIQRVKGVG